MNPSQPKGTSLKHTTNGTLKGQGRGQSFKALLSKRTRATFLSVLPQPKRPRSSLSNVATHVPLFRNSLQKKRYELLQGTRYSCGRQILWNIFAFVDFYFKLCDSFEKMNWMGLATFFEKHYSPLLVNEFYSNLIMHADEYKNLVRFKSNNLYTFINGQVRIITESDLGKLIGYEYYDEPSELPSPYPVKNVWDTLAREPGCKKTSL